MEKKKQPPRGKRQAKGAPVRTVSIDGIAVLPGLLNRIIPATAVEGSANGERTYGMFSVPRGTAGQLGTMRLAKKRVGDRLTLTLTMRDGQCRGCMQKVNATMQCRADQLSTPTQWSVSEQMVRGDTPVPFTRISKTAVVSDGQAIVKDATGSRTIRVAGAYTINWALFDAVGRLPRKAFDPIAFDLIDHFDQLKPGNRLHYRSTQQVQVGGTKTTLHLYDHVGCGIVPWTYFVTDGGVMVLAQGGLEAYGLLAAKGGPS